MKPASEVAAQLAKLIPSTVPAHEANIEVFKSATTVIVEADRQEVRAAALEEMLMCSVFGTSEGHEHEADDAPDKRTAYAWGWSAAGAQMSRALATRSTEERS